MAEAQAEEEADMSADTTHLVRQKIHDAYAAWARSQPQLPLELYPDPTLDGARDRAHPPGAFGIPLADARSIEGRNQTAVEPGQTAEPESHMGSRATPADGDQRGVVRPSPTPNQEVT